MAMPGNAVTAETKKGESGKPGASKPVVPEPPPLPENYNPPEAPDDAAQELEPEITITTKGDTIYEEYRLNGRLYMVKIIPAKGKPYYLIDYEGNGRFSRSDLESSIVIPMWVIKRF